MGVSDDVRRISYRAAARGLPLRQIGGEIFVRLRKENQGSPFPEITSEMAFAECILDHIINFMSN